jgi:hypothetical protein
MGEQNEIDMRRDGIVEDGGRIVSGEEEGPMQSAKSF